MTNQFEGMTPEMTAWWIDHLNDRPVVQIQCGECRKLLGEIKSDGTTTLALRRAIRPEPTVPSPQLTVYVQSSHEEPTEHELEAAERELERRREERNTHVLRPGAPTADGRPTEVMRQRRDLSQAIAPVAVFENYCCPEHGEIAVDTEHLAQFASESDDTLSKTRLYPIPYSML